MVFMKLLDSSQFYTFSYKSNKFQDDELVNQVEESAMLQRRYEKYLDMVIINEDFDQTFQQVHKALEVLSQEHQWVPVNWIY